MASWTKRQGEVTSHSRSYGEELQRSIFVQIASAIGDLESAIGINSGRSLSDQLGFKLAITISGRTDFQLTKVTFEGFLAMAVVAIT